MELKFNGIFFQLKLNKQVLLYTAVAQVNELIMYLSFQNVKLYFRLNSGWCKVRVVVVHRLRHKSKGVFS